MSGVPQLPSSFAASVTAEARGDLVVSLNSGQALAAEPTSADVFRPACDGFFVARRPPMPPRAVGGL